MPTSHYDAIADLIDAFDRRALSAFRQTSAEEKADGTAITSVDRETSDELEAELRQRFPSYGIVSEEEPEPHAPQASRQWVIDPLDGTAMFARGLPLWGLGIGLMQDAEPMEGYLSFPAVGERYVFTGGEFLFNGRPHVPAAVDIVPQTRHILVGSDLVHELPLQRISGYKMRNFGTNLYHLIAVATGRAEAMIGPRCFLWDFIPALPFCRAAGLAARFTNDEPFDVGAFWEPGQRRERMPAPMVVGKPDVVEQIIDELLGKSHS